MDMVTQNSAISSTEISSTSALAIPTNGASKPDFNYMEQATKLTSPKKTASTTAAKQVSNITITSGYTMPPLPTSAHIDPAIAEGSSFWLDTYINHSRKWSPRGYEDSHEAIGLWLLSVIAARRVMLPLGNEKYTNLYIAQVIRTSTKSKTVTANVGTRLLEQAGLSSFLLPDELTPQAMIRNMTQRLPANWAELPEGYRKTYQTKLAFSSQRGWFYDEFGGKVQAMMRDGSVMSEFRTHLRKFDDCRDVFEYETITHGSMILNAPYLSVLANTTPADLIPFAKPGGALWNDGSWARWVFLTPPDNRRSKQRFPAEERETPADLIKPLQHWHARLGVPFVEIEEGQNEKGEPNGKFTINAGSIIPKKCYLGDGVFDSYYRYDDALNDIAAESSNNDLAGNYTRLSEKALRVAMLLASFGNNERIEMRHWARAQQIAEQWRQNLHNLYAAVTGGCATREESLEDRIVGLIGERGALTAREIYRAIKGMGSDDASRMLGSMVKIGILRESAEGKSKRYDLNDNESSRE